MARKSRRKKTMFRNSFYVEAYRLARSGARMKDIASALGVDSVTLYSWKRKDPDFKNAIDEGLAELEKMRSGEDNDMKGFIFDQLPPDLRRTVETISMLADEPNGINRIEAILEDGGKRARQHLFLYTLYTSYFDVNMALRTANISNRTLKGWIDHDPDFAVLLDEIEILKKNWYESRLIDLVKAGDASTVQMVNKTKNADRGYGVKAQVDVNQNVNINVNVVKVSELGLPVTIRKSLLNAVRQRKANEVAGRLISKETA